MKASELRIGNWVYEYGGVYEVTSISRGGQLRLFSADENHTSGVSKVKPIPLTKEWLERFGFEKEKFAHANTYTKFIGDFVSIVVYSNGICEIDDMNEIVSVQQELKHVHTLQNLYFALTGEELELK